MNVRSQIVMILALVGAVARADAPATQPVADDTPQHALATIDDGRAATLKLDQALTYYNFTTPAERKFAEACAVGWLAYTKLEEAVNSKWGSDAYTTVCHTLSDDTRDDDARADWNIVDDHAVGTFKVSGISPQIMVRINGHWKIDITGYMATSQNPAADIKYMRQSAELVNEICAKLNTYSGAEDFLKSFKDQIDKLNNTP